MQRKDNEPIPEIENRLDEFFNLDAPGDGPVMEDTGPIKEIVSFQPDDESFGDSIQTDDRIQPDDGKNDQDRQISPDTELDILIRLKTTLQNIEGLKDESSRISINRDIDQLEKTWENDPEKACLIQIVSSLANQMGIRPGDGLQQHKRDTDVPSEEANGILGKIKGIFTS